MFPRYSSISTSRLILIVALVALAFPAAVAGHSELDTSTPANGASVPAPFDGPIVLHFSAILAAGSKASLLDPAGTTIAAARVDGPGATMTFTLDAALAAGDYQVKWTTVAVDTDVARGTIEFTVAPTASPTGSAPASPIAAPPSAAPASSAASASPDASASPSASPPVGSDTSGGGEDVVLPILVGLIVVGAGAAYLLSRRNRTPAA